MAKKDKEKEKNAQKELNKADKVKEEKEPKAKKDKAKNKNKKEKKNKESFGKGIKKELKLVKWPTLKEIVKYTIATIIFCAALILFFELLTLVVASIKELFN